MDHNGDVQRGEQQDADAGAAGVGAGASASSVESTPDLQPSGKRAGHDRKGKFTKGNTESLKHGRWSAAAAQALLPEQIETLAMLAHREAAVLADLGGASELSTFERDLVRRYQQLDAVAAFNAPRMLSSRAAVRNQARDTFMACVDRQLKIIAQLGLRRRQKDISNMSLQDYLNAQQAPDHEGGIEHGSSPDREQAGGRCVQTAEQPEQSDETRSG